jgi:hypothetical protein
MRQSNQEADEVRKSLQARLATSEKENAGLKASFAEALGKVADRLRQPGPISAVSLDPSCTVIENCNTVICPSSA